MKMIQKDLDLRFMRRALELAEEAGNRGEIPIGAVIVCGDEIISEARNECEALHDATAHAERLAISRAGAARGTWRLSDCTLYVTMEPCPMCAGAAINARIGRIVYGVKDPRAGACESLLRLPSYPLESTPVCESGLLSEECHALLQNFFAERRKRS